MAGSDTDVDPVAQHERYAAAWNGHDVEAVMETFAPDVRYDDPATDGVLGYAELEPFVRETFQGFPDVHFETRERYETDRPGTLVVEWTMHATHSGTFEGLPPTDERVELDGMERFVVGRDGVTEVRGYFDNREFLAQLGLTFPAVLGKVPKLAAGAVRNAL